MLFAEDIHNHYERLVSDRFKELKLVETRDPEFLADLYCIVLNQLPCRYIRFDVDMAFYQATTERQEMEMKVREAIDKSLKYLEDHKEQRE